MLLFNMELARDLTGGLFSFCSWQRPARPEGSMVSCAEAAEAVGALFFSLGEGRHVHSASGVSILIKQLFNSTFTIFMQLTGLIHAAGGSIQ